MGATSSTPVYHATDHFDTLAKGGSLVDAVTANAHVDEYVSELIQRNTSVDPDTEYALPASTVATLESRVADLQLLLGAGLVEQKGKNQTCQRLVEELVAGLARLPTSEEALERRLGLLRLLGPVVEAERAGASAPALPVYQAPSSGELGSKELVLFTLASLARSTAGKDAAVISEPLASLGEMLREFGPAAFFDDWSPRRTGPEADVELDPAQVSASQGTGEAADAITGKGWSSTKGAAKATLTVAWRGKHARRAPALSSLFIEWAADAAPKSVRVEAQARSKKKEEGKKTDEGGDDADDSATLDEWAKVAEIPIADAAEAVVVPLHGVAYAAVRISFAGFQPSNLKQTIGVQRLHFRVRSASALYTPTLELMHQLMDWMAAAASQNASLTEDAFRAMAALASASGSLSALLRFVGSLLAGDGARVLGDDEAAAASAFLTLLGEDAVEVANERVSELKKVHGVVGGKKAGAGPIDAMWDPAEYGSEHIEITNGGKTVRSTGGNAVAVLDHGFSEGVIEYDFKLVEDSRGGECTCFGALTKPITSTSYNSSNNLMYRAYNGQLYGSGFITGESSRRSIHPDDVVTCRLDMDEGTLSYSVNGEDQGVAFHNLLSKGEPLYPAVTFYSTSRVVELVRIERISGGDAAAEEDTAEAADAAGDESDSEIPDEPTEAELRAAHPGIDMLEGMGMPFMNALVAMERADNNVEQAADWLFMNGEEATRMAAAREAEAAARQARREARAKRIAEREAAAKASEEGLDAADDSATAGPSTGEPEADAPSNPNRLPEICGKPRTSGEFARALLRRIASVAAVFSPEMETNDGPVLEEREANSPLAFGVGPDKLLSLDERFCLQADGSTLTMLHELLGSALPAAALASSEEPDGLSETEATVLSLLRIARANLRRLVVSRTELAGVGIEVQGDSPTLAPLVATLRSVASGRFRRRLQVEAVEVIDSGLEVLYGTAGERAELLTELIKEAEAGTLAKDSTEFILLDRLLRRFSAPAGVVSLLPPTEGTFTEKQARDITSLCAMLFNVLLAESRTQLSATGSDASASDSAEDGGENTLLTLGAQLLRTYQVHLLALAAGEGMTALEHPPCRVTVQYSQMLLSHASALVACAMDSAGQVAVLRAAGKPTDASAAEARLDAALQASALGTLLPGFTAASCLLAEQPWLAAGVLPAAVKFIRDLDALNRELPSVQAEDAAAAKADSERATEAALAAAGGTRFGDAAFAKEVTTLPFQIASIDEAERSNTNAKYGPSNVLNTTPGSCWCTVQKNNVNLVLRYTGGEAFRLTEISVKPGGSGFTAPVKDGLVFVFPGEPGVNSTDREWNDCTKARFEAISEAGGSRPASAPVAYFCCSGSGTCTVKPVEVVAGSYVLIKLLGPQKDSNIDIESITLRGNASRVQTWRGYFTNAGSGVKHGFQLTKMAQAELAETVEAAGMVSDGRAMTITGSMKDLNYDLLMTIDGKSGEEPTKLRLKGARSKGSPLTSVIRGKCGPPVRKEGPDGEPGGDDDEWNDSVLTGDFAVSPAPGSGWSGSAAPPSTPWLLDLERTGASLAARLSACMIAGPPVTYDEKELAPWLRSSLMSGGRDASAPEAWRPVEIAGDASPKPEKKKRRGETDPDNEVSDGVDLGSLEWDASARAAEDAVRTVLPSTPRSDAVRKTMSFKMAGKAAAEGARAAAAADTHAWLASVIDGGATDGTPGATLLKFFAAKAPENMIKRRQGTFPDAELPVLAALLKHTGLTDEARSAVAAVGDGGKSPHDVLASSELMDVWRAVTHVRTTLRTQRQAFRRKEAAASRASPAKVSITAASSAPGSSESKQSPAELESKDDGAAPLGGAASAPAVADTATATTASSSAEAESSDSDDDPEGGRRRRKRKPQVPQTMEELVAAVRRRALFVLGLAPGRTTARAADTAAQSQLAEKWTDMVPQPQLQPLLQRWKSTDVAAGGTDKWNSMIGVLRRQASWHRQHSQSSIAEEGEEDDDADEEQRTATGRASMEVARYVVGNGGAIAAPPALLDQLLRRRHARAVYRAFGFRAFSALLEGLLLRTPQVPALLRLRPALRGVEKKEEGADDETDGSEKGHAWSLRHHYMKELEGCTGTEFDSVQAAFVAVYSQLASTLTESARTGLIVHGQLVMWNFGLDLEPRDHEFVLRLALLPELQQVFSLSKMGVDAERFLKSGDDHGAEESKDDGPATGGAGGPADAASKSATAWRKAPIAQLRAGLSSGLLTKREVIRHMRRAPKDLVPAEWWKTHRLDGETWEAARRHSVASLLAAYETFGANEETKDQSDDDSLPIADLVAVDTSGSGVVKEAKYEVVPNGLTKNAVPFNPSMNKRFADVPAAMEGLTFIRVAEKEKTRKDARVLTLKAKRKLRLVVALCDKNAVPTWLSDGYEKSRFELKLNGGQKMHVYRSREVFVSGSTVVVGGAGCASAGSDGIPYCLAIEEVGDSSGDSQPALSTSELDCVGVNTASLFRRTSWTLFRLITALAVGGVASRKKADQRAAAEALGLSTADTDSAVGAAGDDARSSMPPPPPSIGDPSGSAKPASSQPSFAAPTAPRTLLPGQLALSQTLRYSLELQRMAFDLLERELVLGTSVLARHARSLAEGGADSSDPVRALEVMEVEAVLHSQLLFLSSLSNTRPVQLQVAKPSVLRCLLALLREASPRLQRMTLCLLRSVAREVEPTMLDAAIAEVAPEEDVAAWRSATDDRSPFVGMLLSVVARPLCVSPSSGSSSADAVAARAAASGDECLATAQGYGAGHAAQSLACEAVALLRTLLCASRSWSEVVGGVLTDSIVRVAPRLERGDSVGKLRSTSDDSKDAEYLELSRAAASLAVLGGQPQTLRVGGRAIVASETMGDIEATVVQLRPGSDVALVSYGEGISSSATYVSVEALTPTESVRADARAVEMTADLLAVFGCIVRLPDVQMSAAAREALQSSGAPADVLPTVDVSVRRLWRVQIKTLGLSALRTLLGSQRTASAALEAGLLGALYNCALQPVALQSFVATANLERRRVALEARLFEMGAEGCADLLEPLEHDRPSVGDIPLAPTPEAEKAVSTSSSVGASGASATRTSESKLASDEKEEKDAADGTPATKRISYGSARPTEGGHPRSRWRAADSLCAEHEWPLPVCVGALELFADDEAAASEWLRSPAAKPWVEDQAPTGPWRATVDFTGEDEGFSYELLFRLSSSKRGTVSGTVQHKLLACPEEEVDLVKRVGECGTEDVSGTFDPATRTLTLKGKKVDDKSLISADEYKLVVSPTWSTAEGTSAGNYGSWDNVVKAKLVRGGAFNPDDTLDDAAPLDNIGSTDNKALIASMSGKGDKDKSTKSEAELREEAEIARGIAGAAEFTLVPLVGSTDYLNGTAGSVDTTSSDIYKVEFTWVKAGAGNLTGVGFCTKDCSKDQYVGNSSSGWMMICDGRKGHSSSWESYGNFGRWGDGSVVTVTHDRSAGTISFDYNGTSCGVAWTSAELKDADLYPCVSLTNPNDEVVISNSYGRGWKWDPDNHHSAYRLKDDVTLVCNSSQSSGAAAIASVVEPPSAALSAGVALPAVDKRQVKFAQQRVGGEPASVVRDAMDSEGFGGKEITRLLALCEESQEAAIAREFGIGGSGTTPRKALISEFATAGEGALFLTDALGDGGKSAADEARVREGKITRGLALETGGEASYSLGCAYDRLHVMVALDDAVGKEGAPSDVRFEVRGDGRVLWSSRPLREARDIDFATVSVFGVDKVVLTATAEGAAPSVPCHFINPRVAGRGAAALLPGMLLCVGDGSETAPRDVSRAITQNIGTLVTSSLFDLESEGGEGAVKVARRRKGTATVRLRFLDAETGVTHEQDYPFEAVRRVTRMYGVRLAGQVGARSLTAATHGALAAHGARRALESLLQHWPRAVPFTLEAAGGAASVLSLVKLVAAAESVFTRPATRDDGTPDPSGGSAAVGTLRKKLKELLAAEADLPSSAAQLSTALVDECVANFIGSTEPTQAVTVESMHEYVAVADYGGRVCFPGASALRVSFDPRCQLAAKDSTLRFFEGASLEDDTEVAAYSGKGDKWEPLTIAADSLRWHFTSTKKPGSTGHGWGYAFYVTPVTGRWLREAQVLREASLEWACWLLDFLLTEASRALSRGAIHNSKMFMALLRYLRTKGTPAHIKPRVVGLLTQLLASPHMFPEDDRPNLDAMQGVEAAVIGATDSSKGASKALFLPQRLLELVELIIARRSCSAVFKAAVATEDAVTEEVAIAVQLSAEFMGSGGSSGPPSRINLRAAVEAFRDAYPELKCFREEKVEKRIDEWSSMDTERRGIVTIDTWRAHMAEDSASDDREIEASFRAMDIADKGYLDFYDMLYLKAIEKLNPESCAEWWEHRMARISGMLVDDGSPSPPAPEPCRVARPWLDAAGAAVGATPTFATQQVHLLRPTPFALTSTAWAVCLGSAARAVLEGKVAKPKEDSTSAVDDAVRVEAPLVVHPSASLPALEAALAVTGELPGDGGTATGGAGGDGEAKAADPAAAFTAAAAVDGASGEETVLIGGAVVLAYTEDDAAAARLVRRLARDGASAVLLVATSGLPETKPADYVARKELAQQSIPVIVLPLLSAARLSAAADVVASQVAEAAGSGTAPPESGAAALARSRSRSLALVRAASNESSDSAKSSGTSPTRAASLARFRGVGAAVAASVRFDKIAKNPAYRYFSRTAGGAAAAAATAASTVAAAAAEAEARARDAEAAEGAPVSKAEGDTAEDDGAPTDADDEVEAPIRLGFPATSVKTIDALMDVHEMATALFRRRRAPDQILCRAFVDASVVNRVVESKHPYATGAGGVVKGSVTIPGAEALMIHFHPRCSAASGTALRLSAPVRVGADGKAVDGSTVFSKEFSGTVADAETDNAKLWSHEPISLEGDTLEWCFTPADTDTNAKKEFGFAIFVEARGVSQAAQAKLLAANADELNLAAKPLSRAWTTSMDAELVLLVKERLLDLSQDQGTKLQPYQLFITSARAAMGKAHLADVPLSQIWQRFCLLRVFNERLNRVLRLLNMGSDRDFSTGYKLRALGHCIFGDIKDRVLQDALEKTRGSGASAPSLMLDNFKSSESGEKGDIDIESSQCCFVQAFQQLGSVEPESLRMAPRGEDRVFSVKFKGESGIDAGGVYREGLQRIVEDLFSPKFTLLLPCPNAVAKSGTNAASYLPNASLRTPLAVRMFEFLGRFMGMSLRFKLSLPFLFPSAVWKPLVGQKLEHEDLVAMDTLYGQYVHAIEHCDRDFSLDGSLREPVTDEDSFAAAFGDLYFVTNNSAGEEVPLVPEGRTVRVTFANRMRFVRAVRDFRLHEFDAQLAAIRRGLGQVVPLQALRLLTWSELEVAVAGSPVIDVKLLRRFTRYDGEFNDDHPVIKRFWSVFSTLTEDERSKYVRFAWGRSRLPSGSRWTNQHTLQPQHSSDPDKTLPVSHTCFFSLELPMYTSEERMRWGLTTCIYYGGGGILNG